MGKRRLNGEESASRRTGSGGGVDREHQQGDRAVEKAEWHVMTYQYHSIALGSEPAGMNGPACVPRVRHVKMR